MTYGRASGLYQRPERAPLQRDSVSHAHSELAQGFVEGGLLVCRRSAPADDQGTLELVGAGRELFGAGPRNDNAAGADEGAVFYHDGHRPGRLKHTSYAHAPGQMHVASDLGPRADRGPRIHHRPAPDVGPDVHVARHNNHARFDKSPVTHGPRRHDTHARCRQVFLGWDLVVVLERTSLHRLHLGYRKVQVDGLHYPRVRDPLAAARLCNAQFAPVKRGDSVEDRRTVLLRFQQPPVLERGLYSLLYSRPPLTLPGTDMSASLAGACQHAPYRVLSAFQPVNKNDKLTCYYQDRVNANGTAEPTILHKPPPDSGFPLPASARTSFAGMTYGGPRCARRARTSTPSNGLGIEPEA